MDEILPEGLNLLWFLGFRVLGVVRDFFAPYVSSRAEKYVQVQPQLQLLVRHVEMSASCPPSEMAFECPPGRSTRC